MMPEKDQNASLPSDNIDTTPTDVNSNGTGIGESSVDNQDLPESGLGFEPASGVSIPAADSEVEPPTQGSSMQSNLPQAELQAVSSPEVNQAESLDSTPVPTSAPVLPQPPTSDSGLGSTASKKNKKGLIAAIVAAVVAVLLIGGGALAYNLWYQNPDKVIGDALGNMIVAKKAKFDGTVSVKSNEIDMLVSLNGQSADGSGGGDAELTLTGKENMKTFGTVKVSASYVTSSKDGAYYFKLTNVKNVVDKFVNSMVDSLAQQYKQYGMTMTEAQIAASKQEYQKALSPIVTKIDNRWVKFTADDLNSDSSADDQTCYTDAIKQLQENRDERDELVKVYKQHKFITVNKKLGSKDGSLGYDLSIDKTKSKAFSEAVKDTTFGKEMAKCDKSKSSSDSTSDDDSTATMELWVTRWSHQISELKATIETKDDSAKEDTTADIDLNFDMGKGEAVEAPSDAVSIKDLQAEIQQVYGGGASSTSSTSFSI